MSPSDDLLSDFGHRAMSIEEIGRKANEFEWNPNIGFKYWVRAAEAIYHEGQVHRREGNLSSAYMFFLRHSTLIIDFLPKHPQAKESESKRAMRPLIKRIPLVISQLEDLKPDITKAHEEWLKISAAQRNEPRDTEISDYAKHASNDPALSWNPVSPAKILDAGEHQDLAVDLAKKEMRRRRRQAGVTEEDEQRRRTGGVWEGWSDDAATHAPVDSAFHDDQDLRMQIAATRRRLDQSGDAQGRDQSLGSGYNFDSRQARYPDQSSQFSSTNYHYPSINKSAPIQYDQYDSRASKLRKTPPAPQPPRPPKVTFREVSSPPPRYRTPPPLPSKEVIGQFDWREPNPYGQESIPPPPSSLPPSSLPPLLPPLLPPKTALSPPQKRITFRPAAYLENGDPIRPVFIPTGLREAFLKIAAEHTRKGLELCGMLCGTPVNNALFVSCLLIPEQKSTSDTCDTENESSMLDYCINEDLLIIGWIHTHPTQTCFMSSRDLHTQAGYQLMMPESIAIVCAPRFEPSYGIFRLTNPPGLQHIIQCQHSDAFHQHSIDNLYRDAENPPGHVYETDRMDFYVHDLRPKQ